MLANIHKLGAVPGTCVSMPSAKTTHVIIPICGTRYLTWQHTRLLDAKTVRLIWTDYIACSTRFPAVILQQRTKWYSAAP